MLCAVSRCAMCRVVNLGPKNSVSVQCEADTTDAIAATWDYHDNILIAHLSSKFSHIDMRKPVDKGKARPVDKFNIGLGDDVSHRTTTTRQLRLGAYMQCAGSASSNVWAGADSLCCICLWYGSNEPSATLVKWSVPGTVSDVEVSVLILQVVDVRFIDRGRRVLVATPHGVEVGYLEAVIA